MRLMGVDFYRFIPNIPPWGECPLLYYNLMDLLKQHNANAIRIHASKEPILFGLPEYGLPTETIQSWCKTAITQGEQKGIKVILSGHPSNNEDWANKASIILNENGLGDEWISEWTEIIKILQPQGIEIMNEPPDAGLSGNPNLTFVAYRQFCIEAINAYRAVKPNLIIFVDGCPFWNPGMWASDPLPFSNVYYTFHLHYGVLGLQEAPTGLEDWWNAYLTGDLAQAKIFLEDYLLNGQGMKALLDKGLPIQFIESGTSLEQPNWDAWLRDMYVITAKYNAGFQQFSLGANPPDINGILEADWETLNPMGLIWAENMPKPSLFGWILVPIIIGGIFVGYLLSKKKNRG